MFTIADGMLGFAIYVVIFSLFFLGGLPFIAEKHKAGENMSPLLLKLTAYASLLSLASLLIGYWLYDKVI